MKKSELKSLIKEVVQEMAYQPSRKIEIPGGNWRTPRFKYIPEVPLNSQERTEFEAAAKQAAEAIVDKYPEAKQYLKNLEDIVKKLNIPKSWAITAMKQAKQEYSQSGETSGRPTLGVD